nr:adenylate/guanylate cyclase domain-containing protein [Oscillatoria laete-virens]
MILAVAATVVSLLCARLTWIENLNWLIHDHFQKSQARSHQPASDEIILITIDEVSLASCSHLAGSWPWRRDSYAALLLMLDRMGARAVGIDILFQEPSVESYYDDLLLSVIESLDMPVVLSRLESRPLAEPFNRWKWQGDVDLVSDLDGVTRRVASGRAFAESLARCTGTSGNVQLPDILRFHGSFSEAWAEKSYQAGPLVIEGFRILEEASKQTDILEPGKLRGWLEKSKAARPDTAKPLEGKIVIVGTTAAGTFDVKSTPVGAAEPGMTIHAAALRNLLTGEGIGSLPHSVVFLTGLLLSLLIAIGAARIQRVMLFAGMALLICLGIYLVSEWLLSAGWWLPPAGGIASVMLTAAGAVVMNYRAETLHKREVTGLFGRFVSPAVVEALVANPGLANPGGREAICTVFFSDLEGFTSISERLAPQTLVELINEYLETMSRTVLDHGGTIDKYIGDAVMAFWNAPLPQSDHAARACACALRCHRAVEELQVRFSEKYGVRPRTRFGLHTGPVVVGTIGSRARLDYTVLGDTVNLSSRLEGANKNYGTTFLVTAATKELTAAQFAWRPVDLLRVKGKETPVPVFELLGFADEPLSGAEQMARQAFEAGFDLYRAGQFARAAENFRLALKEKKEDALYALYAERTENFLKNPPPENWDGVFTMKSK